MLLASFFSMELVRRPVLPSIMSLDQSVILVTLNVKLVVVHKLVPALPALPTIQNYLETVQASVRAKTLLSGSTVVRDLVGVLVIQFAFSVQVHRIMNVLDVEDRSHSHMEVLAWHHVL